MASIVRRQHRKSIPYYVDYYVNGRRVRRKIGRSLGLAKKVKGDIEAKLERQEAGLLPKDAFIESFLDEYLKRTEDRQAPGYRKRIDATIDHLRQFLKEKAPYATRLSQLDIPLIEDYMHYRQKRHLVDKTKKPLKKRTINLEISMIKTILGKAVRWKFLNANPAQDIEYLKADDSKYRMPLTEREVHLLLKNSPDWFYPVLYTALFTGLREGEVIHLEWSDVDLENKRIYVRRKEGWIPKSSGKEIREREVSINSLVIKLLAEHKLKSKSQGDKLVFHGPTGGMLTQGLCRKVIHRTAVGCGLGHVTEFHLMRTTYATHLIKSGVDLVTAKEELGHADIHTTMRYAKSLNEHRTQMAEKLTYGLADPKAKDVKEDEKAVGGAS